MTDQELTQLVGLPFAEAEERVKAAGLKPRCLHKDTFVTMACLPRDTVSISYDDSGVVVGAETQESIDAAN